MYYTYILQSLKSGRFYIGHTSDLEMRLRRHNAGYVKATRNKGPWIIARTESFLTKVEANRRELDIKNQKSRKYIMKLISDDGPDSYRDAL